MMFKKYSSIHIKNNLNTFVYIFLVAREYFVCFILNYFKLFCCVIYQHVHKNIQECICIQNNKCMNLLFLIFS